MKERELPATRWAVIVNGRLALCDHRCPIFWLRRQAKQWQREHNLDDAYTKIVKVDILRRGKDA